AKLDNVLFDATGDRALGLIDLDTVMPGTILWDVGDLVRTATCPVREDEPDLTRVRFRADWFDALVAGYLAEARAVLSDDELAGALYAPDQPARVRGDPEVGIVASTTWGENGFVRLLVVDPDHRGSGHGRALLDAAETDLREQGVGSVTVGADAPYYLFPGVETTELAMLCLLERRKYWRAEANFNMDVDLDTIPPDEGGAAPATAGERDEVDRWMAQHWEMWRPEVLRALDKDRLLLSRDDESISAF